MIKPLFLGILLITISCDPGVTRSVVKSVTKSSAVGIKTFNFGKKAEDGTETKSLAGVNELEKTDNQISFVSGVESLDIQSKKMDDGNNYDEIMIPGTVINTEPGEPQIPIYLKSVPLPQNNKANLVIDNVEWEKLEGNFTVAPTQYPLIDADEGVVKLPFIKNEQAYNVKDSKEEPPPVKILGITTIRGKRFVEVSYTPTFFNPTDKSIMVASEVGFHLELETDESLAAKATKAEDAEGFSGGQYVIITYDDFYESAKTLADWKYQKGLKTVIAKASEISSTNDKDAIASNEIKDYLQTSYKNWVIKPEYILIIGNLDKIPASKIVKHLYLDEEFPTDLYYSTLDGYDYQPDVMIGRFACSTPTECSKLIDKTLTYQTKPDLSPEYWQNVLIAAEFEGNKQGYEKRTYIETAEAHRAYWQNQGYSVTSVYQSDVSVKKYYHSRNSILHEHGSIFDPQPQFIGANTLATNAIIDGINQGTFLIMHRGHGLPEGWVTPHLTAFEIERLANNNKLPVVFSLNCLTGIFGSEFSQAWMTAATGGTHAFIGATESSSSGYNDWFAHGLVNSLQRDFFTTTGQMSGFKNPPFTDNNWKGQKIGEMLNYAKRMVYDNYSTGEGTQLTYELYHLQGDPEMDVRTSLPQEIEVSHPSEITLNSPNMDIVCTQDEEPLEFAEVALTLKLEDEAYSFNSESEYQSFVGITDDEGNVKLRHLPFKVGDTLTLTVTEQNSLPFETIIKVTGEIEEAEETTLLALDKRAIDQAKEKLEDDVDWYNDTGLLRNEPIGASNQTTLAITISSSGAQFRYKIITGEDCQDDTTDYSQIKSVIDNSPDITDDIFHLKDGKVTVCMETVDTGGNRLDFESATWFKNIVGDMPVRFTTHIGVNHQGGKINLANAADRPQGIDLDNDGNIYIVGLTKSNLAGLDGTSRSGISRKWDNFVVKFDSSGTLQNAFQKGLGTSDHDYPGDIAVKDDFIYITGKTRGSLGDENGGNYDAFLLKLNKNSGDVICKAQLGKSMGSTPINGISTRRSMCIDVGVAIDIDESGNIYMSGHTKGHLGEINTNARTRCSKNNFDAFITKFDSECNLQWTKQLGSDTTISGKNTDFTSEDQVTDLVISKNGLSLYLAGFTKGNMIETKAGGETTKNAYIAKLSATNGDLEWITQMGSESLQNAALGINNTSADTNNYGIALDQNENIIMTGTTSSNLIETNNTGKADIIFAKANSQGEWQWIKQIGTQTASNAGKSLAGNNIMIDTISNDKPSSIIVDSANNIIISGSTESSLGANNLGKYDYFIARANFDGEMISIIQLGSDKKDQATDLVIDDKGNCYVTGITQGNLNQENNPNDRYDDIFITSYQDCAAQVKPNSCINLPANAQWNSTDSFNQYWIVKHKGIGGEWKPKPFGYFNFEPSNTDCRFKCQSDYSWNESSNKCEYPFIQFTVNNQINEKEIDANDVTITVTLSSSNISDATVAYEITGGTANSSDYTGLAQTGTFTITGGDTTTTATLKIENDNVYESSTADTLIIKLKNPVTKSQIGERDTFTISITDDDPEPSIFFTTDNIETHEGNAPSYVAVTLSHPSQFDVSVDYAIDISNSSATNGDDYQFAASGTFTVPPYQLKNAKKLTIENDNLAEGLTNETIIFNLANPSGGLPGTPDSLTISIEDDEASPIASFASTGTSINEDGAGRIQVGINLTSTGAVPILINYEIDTANSTAKSPEDFTTATTGNVIIPAGDSVAYITTEIVDDEIYEGSTPDILIFKITGSPDTRIGDSDTFTLTIKDDGDLPQIYFVNEIQSIMENQTSTNVALTMSNTIETGISVTIAYAVDLDKSTANDPDDYRLNRGNFTFAPGETLKEIAVNLVDNIFFEMNETVVIKLSDPLNATIGSSFSTHTLTITDDDPPPKVDFVTTPNTVKEEDGKINLSITLSGVVASPVTINYTIDGNSTATNGDDFSLASGSFNIPALQTKSSIKINIVNDSIYEGNETMTFKLGTPPENFDLGTTTSHTITIEDNDTEPTVYLTTNEISIGENNPSTAITVTLSNLSKFEVTVPYTIDTANSTAINDTDYQLATSGTFTIAPLSLTDSTSITPLNDTIYEGVTPETVLINLGNPNNASIGATTSTTISITDDEEPPTVSFASTGQQVNENTAGDINISVNLSSKVPIPIAINYSVNADSTALNPGDHNLLSDNDPISIDGSITIAAMDVSASKTITIVNDDIYEGSDLETLIIDLRNSTDVSIGANRTHTVSISDEDDIPVISFIRANQTVNEKDDPSTTVALTISKAIASNITVSIDYKINEGTTTANNPADHNLANGNFSFSPSDTSKIININLKDDGIYEENEVLKITLSNPLNARVGDTYNNHTITITDEEDRPQIELITATSNAREDDGTTTISVTLSGPCANPVSLGYTIDTANTTATDGNDFTLATSNFSVYALQTSASITMSINNDGIYEGSESIKLLLAAAPANVDLGMNTTHTLTLEDDDPKPTIFFSANNPGTFEEAETDLLFSVSLSNPSATDVSVNFAISGNSTAVATDDYTIADTSFSIAAEQTSNSVNLHIVNDDVFEGTTPETLIFDLVAPPVGVDMGTPASITLSITDVNDIPKVEFTSINQEINEGQSGTLQIRATKLTDVDVNVNYQILDNSTAETTVDHQLPDGGNFVLAAGQWESVINFNTNPDNTYEGNETIVITLSGSDLSLGTNTVHTVTLNDDEDLPQISFDAPGQPRKNEGDLVNVIVNLSKSATVPISVNYQIEGSATPVDDHSFNTTGTFEISALSTSLTLSGNLIPDDIYEADETLIFTLMEPVNNAVIESPSSHSVTIDGGQKPVVSFVGSTPLEVTESVGSVVVAVTLSSPSTDDVTIPYTLEGSTTNSDDHNLLASGSFNISNPATSAQLSININDDNLYERSETLVIKLDNNPTNAVPIETDTSYRINIADETDYPTLSFELADQSATEGTTAKANVVLSNPSVDDVTVLYIIDNTSTAVADNDYTLSNGLLLIAAQSTKKSIDVPIIDDQVFEAPKFLKINLGTPNNANSGDIKSHTINLDDSADKPTIGFKEPIFITIAEETGGASITLNLSKRTSYPVKATYTVAGTATAGDHDLTSGTFTIPPNTLEDFFGFTIFNNDTFENDETVEVIINSVTNADIDPVRSNYMLTISDENDIPKISFTAATQAEKNEGDALTVNLLLSKSIAINVSVDYIIEGNSENEDHTLSSGTLNISPADGGAARITGTINQDDFFEGEETIEIILNNPVGISLGDVTKHTIIINDDSDRPELSFTVDQEVNEDDGMASIGVELNRSSLVPITVEYVIDTTASTVTADDHQFGAGSFSISPYELNASISRSIANDNIYEDDEVLVFKLQNAMGAQVVKDTHRLTILDDNDQPKVFFTSSSQSRSEGSSPAVRVEISPSVDLDVTVDYTIDGSASSTDDHEFSSGTLTFTSTKSSIDITGLIKPDNVYEFNETIELTLTNPDHLAIDETRNTHVITIDDEDDKPTVSFVGNTFTTQEGNAVIIYVEISNQSEYPVTVDYTVEGTASDDDHTFREGTVTIPFPKTRNTISALTDEDDIFEGVETIILSLLDPPANADLNDSPNTYTISVSDDADYPNISYIQESKTVFEGTLTEVTVTISNPSTQTVSAEWAIDAASTVTGSDHNYQSSGTFYVIYPATTDKIEGAISNDGEYEPPETLVFNLTNSQNGNLGDPKSFTLNIDDQSDLPVIQLTGSGQYVYEGENLILTVSTTNVISADTTVPILLASGGSAIEGMDFNFTATAITIPQGDLSVDFPIPINGDTESEFDENFTIEILEPDYGVLGSSSKYKVTIYGDLDCVVETVTTWPPATITASDCPTIEVKAGGKLTTDVDGFIATDVLKIYGEFINNGELTVNTKISSFAGTFTQSKTGVLHTTASTDIEFQTGINSWSIYNHDALDIPTFRSFTLTNDTTLSTIMNPAYSNFEGYENYGMILKVESDVTILSGSQINVDGKGWYRSGPGFDYLSTHDYGSIAEPTTAGSGGKICAGDAGGGVVHLIVNGTLTLDGSITANGLNGTCNNWGNSDGASSGGSIWVEADKLYGTGFIEVKAGKSSRDSVAHWGGRVSIRAANSTETDWSRSINADGAITDTNYGSIHEVYKNNLFFYNQSTPLVSDFNKVTLGPNTSISAPEGKTRSINEISCQNGTITVPEAASTRLIVGIINNNGCTINNSGYLEVTEKLDLINGTLNNTGELKIIRQFNLQDGIYEQLGETATLTANSTLASLNVTGSSSWSVPLNSDIENMATFAQISVLEGGTLSSKENPLFDNAAPYEYYAIILKAQNMNVYNEGSVNVDVKGYPDGYGIDPSYPAPGQRGCGKGAYHGGTGSNTYGDYIKPLTLGSAGGGTCCCSGYRRSANNGGGIIYLLIEDTLNVDGTLTATGGGGGWQMGSGSGGSIWIDTNNLYGNGAIKAAGGEGSQGGGSGGRIAVYANSPLDDWYGFINHYGASQGNGPTGSFYWKGVTLVSSYWQIGPSSASNLGGDVSAEDGGNAVAMDNSGNIYLAGYTYSNMKETGSSYNGGKDIFLAKYNSSGNLIWIYQDGTDNHDEIYDIAIDNSNNIYIAGYTNGNLAEGEVGGTANDIYFAKINSDGVFQWDRQFGTLTAGDDGCPNGPDNAEEAYGIVVDNGGNPIIAGRCDDMGFFAQYSSSNGAQNWFRLWGPDEGYPSDIAIDSASNLYLTGYTTSTTYADWQGQEDFIIEKYNSNGSSLTWGKQIGTMETDIGYSLAIDSFDNVYVTGATESFIAELSSGFDIFLIKYNSGGTQQWIKQIGQDTAAIYRINNGGHDYPGSLTVGSDSLVLAGSLGNSQIIAHFKTSTGEIIEFLPLTNAYAYDITISPSAPKCYVAGKTQAAYGEGESSSGGWDAFITILDNCD